jgi:hypothetical protein
MVILVTVLIIYNKYEKGTIETIENDLTVLEAFDLGYERALKWEDDIQLFQLTSVDDKHEENQVKGENGTRRDWNLQFVKPGTNEHLLISISDRNITNFEPITGPNIPKKNILIDEILFDSNDLIKLAKENENLYPGSGWAVGYHYSLNKLDGDPVISVVGTDEIGNFTKLYYSASTKNLIDAIHKVPVGGGIYYINNKENKEQEKLKFKDKFIVLGASTLNNSMVVWGSMNHNLYDPELVLVYSKNKGNTWSILRIPQKYQRIINTWFSDDTSELFLATPNEIFKIVDKKWSSVYKTANGVNIIDTQSLGDTIIILEEHGKLQVSNNSGLTWDNVDLPLTESQSIQYSEGGLYVISKGFIYKREEKAWSMVKSPILGNIRDMKLNNKYLTIFTSEKVAIYDIEKTQWETIQHDDVKAIYYHPTNITSIFVVSHDDRITEYIKGGDKWQMKNELTLDVGRVVGFFPSTNKELLVAARPKLEWKKYKKKE